MEKIKYFFNIDFETKLFQDNPQYAQPSKITQEFEYFVNYLEDHCELYTLKKYSKQFIEKFESFTNRGFFYTPDKQGKINFWCSEYTNLELKRRFQSKVSLYKILISKGIISTASIIKSHHELEEGYLYKYPQSMSGMGHYFYPQHKQKLLKYIDQNDRLIKEKILNRVRDFSTLMRGHEVIAQYENIVDQYFQYKGTNLESGFSYSINKKLKSLLVENFKNYKEYYCFDSFEFINDEGSKELYPICEFNMRRSMGYFAYQFWKKYLNQYEFCLFRIMNHKQVMKLREFDFNYLNISPTENHFQVLFFYTNDEKLYKNMKSKLGVKFFNKI